MKENKKENKKENIKENLKERLRDLRSSSVLPALFCLIYGIVLIIWPDISANFICYAIGVAIMLVGIIFVIRYIRKDLVRDFYRKDLVIGLIAISLGLVALLRVELVKELIPTILGIIVLFSGIVKLQNAIDMFRMKYAYWYIILILSVLNMGFGILLIVEPLWIVNVVFVLIGCGLVYSGISDLVTLFFITKTIKNMVKESDIID